MQQRLEVLKDLQEASLSITEIVIKYGIHTRTVQRIKRNAAKISAFADKDKGERKRQRIKVPIYVELDKHLLEWCIERRTLGVHLTDTLILEKAQELKENLPSCSRCKLSYGWLVKFKKRHGIRFKHMHAKETSADHDTVDIFVDNFKNTTEEKNIN
ncbi:hypothetical protein KM043_002598 [Ampulex compressa]|nr:hypothetical protein KM043_002598 [Ampulex compressa]